MNRRIALAFALGAVLLPHAAKMAATPHQSAARLAGEARVPAVGEAESQRTGYIIASS
jgi:hypothetical protein